MGSFRTVEARLRDVRRLVRTPEKPTDVECSALGEGESITYWSVLPHSAARTITTAATHATVDRKGKVSGTFDPGAAAMARLKAGIVDWVMFDEAGNAVPWVPAKASELLDGLDTALVKALGDQIDAGSPPSLAMPADPDSPEGETEGNG